MLRRNVLIFQLGGLGDFVLTWPFALAMGRIYPQSRVIYVTHGQKGLLAERVLRLESRDIESGWHGLFTDTPQLPAATRSLLESSHTIYSFLPVTAQWQQNIERITPGAKQVIIDPKPSESFTGHVTEWMLQSLADFKVERAATEQILRSIQDRGTGFRTPSGTEVVIHPGSGAADKCWPIARWIELAGALKTAGRSVRFVVGEVERERWSKAQIKSLTALGNVQSCNTCIELLSELSTAGVFVGNDSGPGHLAGILGVPTVTLFGPTNPTRWHALGPRVRTLPSFESLTVDSVRQAIDEAGSQKPLVRAVVSDRRLNE